METYKVEEAEPVEGKHIGRVRTFMATGERGATYGAFLYPDGTFHWLNLRGDGGRGVPVYLSSRSPLDFVAASGVKQNPSFATHAHGWIITRDHMDRKKVAIMGP